jgi:5,5'-dehydrodivanillate O-demethylase
VVSGVEVAYMMTPEDNELLTRVGPGTKMGELLRRHWHPIAATVR